MLSASALAAALLLGLAACTVKVNESSGTGGGAPSGSGGGAGAPVADASAGGGTDAGSAAGTGSSADASGTDGAGGPDAVLACGAVTEAGQCSGSTLVYCDQGVLTSVDCARIGASCVAGTSGATCAAERAAPCGSLTAKGMCDGATIRYCDTTGAIATAREINCAAYGQVCDPTGASDGGALCKPQGVCPTDGSVTDSGVCSTENVLSFCDSGNLYKFDCGVDVCQTAAGFSDCFMAGATAGCGGETGHCDGTTAVTCLGNVVAREDCATLGLECQTDATRGALCKAGACPAACPTGYTCGTSGAEVGRCVAASATRDWTFAVYIVGDNNLADAAWVNLNQMEVAGSTSQVQVVTEFELSQDYSQLAPAQYRTGAYRMPIKADTDTDNVTSVSGASSLGNLNLSSPTELASFVKWSAETYPAKHYALVLWNHGGGFQGGWVSSSTNKAMTLRDLVDGVRQSGVHPDVLGFDACLMGMHEVALAFRGLADVLVASEQVEPGAGYPYDQFLSRLVSTPSMTPSAFGQAIVEEYAKSFEPPNRSQAVTMSAFDLSQADSANLALAAFSQSMNDQMSSERVALRSAVDDGSVLRFKEVDYADSPSAATAIGGVNTTLQAAAATYKAALAPYLLSKQGTGSMSEMGGVSFFLPSISTSEDVSGAFDYYRQATSFLPLQPWQAVVGNLISSNVESSTADAGVAAGAASTFSVILTWANAPDGTASGADLDLYVYEPSGDFGSPVNGSVSPNGYLSADSYDTHIARESYELQPSHESGSYIVLVNVSSIPTGEKAYPRLQILRDDLPGGSRTLVRGKLAGKDIQEVPMDLSAPLTKPIDASNFDGVLNLQYSNLWYATVIEVK